jgi:transcriptional regulator with XRE-family HTH domain
VRGVHRSEDEAELRTLLKSARTRIHPEASSLGPYVRRPLRIGKTVSQEELAEAVGATRQWYCSVESGRAAHFSSAMLGRIADALSLDLAERASLFELTVPHLRGANLYPQSIAMFEAFRAIRSFARRLWIASSEEEVLLLAREQCVAQFAPDGVVSNMRVGQGEWRPATSGNPEACRRLEEMLSLMCTEWQQDLREELYGYPFRARPNDVHTLSALPPPSHDLAVRLSQAIKRTGWSDFDFMRATIEPRYGPIGQIGPVFQARRAFSELDRALLSTIADFTTLAISRR